VAELAYRAFFRVRLVDALYQKSSAANKNMKLLVLVATVALVTCESPSDHDALSEMREEFAQMRTENAEMKAEMTKIAQLEAEITELKAQRITTTPGELKFFVDGRTVCPDGMVEVNATKGRVLLGKPDGGKTGAVFNRPLDVGEVGRSPPHSHAVTVNDPGHTHVGIVYDPGHAHTLGLWVDSPPGPAPAAHQKVDYSSQANPVDMVSFINKTGISIENLPAKSAVSASVDANDAGEHLPLVYVLICQKVA
jgi:hypothetical protein